jgi:hypothetical protein
MNTVLEHRFTRLQCVDASWVHAEQSWSIPRGTTVILVWSAGR